MFLEGAPDKTLHVENSAALPDKTRMTKGVSVTKIFAKLQKYVWENCGKCTRLEREWESEEREDLLSEIFSQPRIGGGGKSRLKVRKYKIVQTGGFLGPSGR